MSGAETVLAALALPGARAQAIATVICRLVTDGFELGELEEQTIRADTGMRTIRVPPAIWFARLAKAIDRGAIDKLPPDAIAARIVTTPEPAAI